MGRIPYRKVFHEDFRFDFLIVSRVCEKIGEVNQNGYICS